MTHGSRVWLTGLVNAMLGAFAQAVPLVFVNSVFIDPKEFNPFDRGVWWKLASAIVWLMVINVGLYLKTHPIPDPTKDIDAAEASARIVTATIAKTDTYQIQRELERTETASTKGLP